MAAAYVDFDAAGSGHAGTTGDPWSAADVATYIAVIAGTMQELICRGQWDATALGVITFIKTVVQVISAWDSASPWRIRCVSIADSHAAGPVMSGGIVYATTGAIGASGTLTDMFLFIGATGCQLYCNQTRCTVVMNSIPYDAASTLAACVFDKVGAVKWGNTAPAPFHAHFGTSVTDATGIDDLVNQASGGGGVDTGGMVYSATLAAAPAWDAADLTDFDLYAGYGVGAPGSWAGVSVPAEKRSKRRSIGIGIGI